MHNLFGPILSHLQFALEHGGYIVLFIITTIESLPALGSLVPGHTVVILSGFLAKLGLLHLSVVIPIVIVAAMLGDYIGYYLGSRYGYPFLKSFGKLLFIKEEYIDKARNIINNHTGKSIVIGRFNPITRPLVPFIIGASNVHVSKFWLFDFLGVLLWSLLSIGIGYIFGASYHIAAGILGKFIIVAILIALLIVLGYKIVNKQFHIFAKYELIVLFFNLLGLYGFFKTVQDALADMAFMANLDIWINEFFHSHIYSTLVFIMKIISDIFSPLSLSALSILMIVYFIHKSKWRYAVITFLSAGGGLIISAFVKELIARPRPEFALITEYDYSFPSGHALMVTVFFTLIIYFFARSIKSILWREISISLSVLAIILTMFSRVYLEVHWLSDVVAGCSLGLFWTTFIILFIRYAGLVWSLFKRKNFDIK